MPNPFQLQQSLVLRMLIVLVHLLSIAVIAFSDMANILKWMLETAIVISALYYIWRYSRSLDRVNLYLDISSQPVRCLQSLNSNSNQDDWQIVLPQTIVTTYFILLCTQEKARNTHVQKIKRLLILRDSLGAEPFRQLSVLLRLG